MAPRSAINDPVWVLVKNGGAEDAQTIEIGDIVINRRQRMECIAVVPHVAKDGRQTSLCTWRLHCVEPGCGLPHEFIAGGTFPISYTAAFSRYCPAHRDSTAHVTAYWAEKKAEKTKRAATRALKRKAADEASAAASSAA